MSRSRRSELIDRASKARDGSVEFAVYVLATGRVVFHRMQRWIANKAPDDEYLIGVYRSRTVMVSEVVEDIEAELVAKGFPA